MINLNNVFLSAVMVFSFCGGEVFGSAAASDDEQLAEAIRRSLAEIPAAAAAYESDDQDDEDLERAIDLSLAGSAAPRAAAAIPDAILEAAIRRSFAEHPAVSASSHSASAAAAAAAPVVKRKINSKDMEAFGAVQRDLVVQQRQELLALEADEYPDDQIFEFEGHFEYGADGAADAMGIPLAEAQALETRIVARKAQYEGKVTNPADKETYLRAYIKKTRESREFAERIYKKIMGT